MKLYPLSNKGSGINSSEITKAISDSSKAYHERQRASDQDREIILGEGGVLCDLPFEWQVYRLIVLAGERGVTAAVRVYPNMQKLC